MKEFHNKKKVKRVLYSKLSILLVIIMLFFVARASFNVYKKESESRANALQAETGLKDLQAREETLSSEIERLNTPNGVEEEIREKFKMAKPNENMVVIVGDEEKKVVPEEKIGFFKSLELAIEGIFKK